MNDSTVSRQTSRRAFYAQWALLVAFAIYVAATRTRGISDTFQLLDDQIRDWRIALGGWQDLPLAGPPSSYGGRCCGPASYWVLWLLRHLIGPFTGNLPHAGGIGEALLQAAADTWLFAALRRRIAWPLALAAALLIATEPFDVGLSAAVWNPPIATAFVKMAMASLLWLDEPSRWRVAGTVALAVIAVQAHTTAIFVAAPVTAALVARHILSRQWGRALQAARVAVVVVDLLTIPFIIFLVRHPAESIGPGRALNTASAGSGAQPVRSFVEVAAACERIIVGPERHALFAIGLASAILIGLWRFRRQPEILAVTVAPILLASLAFVTWPEPLDPYWMLTVAPSAVLCIAFAVHGLGRPVARVLGPLGLALVLIAQPARVAASMDEFRFPAYGPIVTGVRTTARRADTVREIKLSFQSNLEKNIPFLYGILGGEMTAESGLTAVIDSSGEVTFISIR